MILDDIAAAFEPGFRAIYKRIEAKAQVAMGRKPSTANRSAGQFYGKRGRYGESRTGLDATTRMGDE